MAPTPSQARATAASPAATGQRDAPAAPLDAGLRPLLSLAEAEVEACCAPLRSTTLSAQDAPELARRFAALADPVRLRLLSILATAPDGAVCACDLVEPVGKSQPTVSHHLKILREAGLVVSEKRGTNVWYAAVPAALERLREVLALGR